MLVRYGIAVIVACIITAGGLGLAQHLRSSFIAEFRGALRLGDFLCRAVRAPGLDEVVGISRQPPRPAAYKPMVFIAVNGPEPVQRGIAWWGSLGVPRWHSAHFQVDSDRALNFSGPDEPFGRMWLEPASGIVRAHEVE